MGDREDRIQRALNESKKREIEDKYGASFSDGESKAPPEIESRFLRHVEEFELQYENAERVTVREFVGNPDFAKLDDIPADRLEEELETVLECLAEHNVAVAFLSDAPLGERYRFITEELLDTETDNITIEGMTHNFIYEEFHPNDQYDAKMFAESFLRFLLSEDVTYAVDALCKDELLDEAGKTTERTVVEESIRRLRGRVLMFDKKSIEPMDCNVEGDYASVSFNITWDALMADDSLRKTYSGIAHLRMKRSEYDGWDVVQAIVPGWNAD